MEMYKLVSPIENGIWSFLNGYQYFKSVVWIGDKDEASKYVLLDENKDKTKIKSEDCFEKV